MKKTLLIVLAALLCLSLVACGADPAPAATASQPAQQEPAAPEPVSEPEPEPEPEPENYVPHEPIVFNGNGDDVVEMPLLDYYYAFHITGNTDSRHFSVKAYDGAGNYNDLLVNTTSAYDGVTYDQNLNTEMLEISASGDWTVEVIDMYTIDAISSGRTYSGSGDYVLAVINPSKTATISGNSDGHHFAIKSFGYHGEYIDLLVNTTDPYNGKVIIDADSAFFVITSESDWTITMN